MAGCFGNHWVDRQLENELMRHLNKEDDMEIYWVYIQSEPNLYTVGFYKPDGKWEPESDHSSRNEAAKRVHYLNGGSHD